MRILSFAVFLAFTLFLSRAQAEVPAPTPTSMPAADAVQKSAPQVLKKSPKNTNAEAAASRASSAGAAKDSAALAPDTKAKTRSPVTSVEELSRMIMQGGNLVLGAPGADGLPRRVALPAPVLKPAPLPSLALMQPNIAPPTDVHSTPPSAAKNKDEAFAKLFSFKNSSWQPLNPEPAQKGMRAVQGAAITGSKQWKVDQKKTQQNEKNFLPIRHTYLPSQRYVELKAVDAEEELQGGNKKANPLAMAKAGQAMENGSGQAEKSAASAGPLAGGVQADLEILEALKKAVQEVGSKGMSLLPR